MIDYKNIFVVSAPSGTGKTTLNRRLVQESENIRICVSHTTRLMREKEKEGDHYFFVTKSEFEEMIKSSQMIEWAEVFENYYGTSKAEIERLLSAGMKVLLEIDVQGWQQIQQKFPEIQAIMILPPTLKDLWSRLQSRGSESIESCVRRIKTAKYELSQAHSFDFYLINKDLDSCYQELAAWVLNAETPKLSKSEALEHISHLLNEFDAATWLQEAKNKSSI